MSSIPIVEIVVSPAPTVEVVIAAPPIVEVKWPGPQGPKGKPGTPGSGGGGAVETVNNIAPDANGNVATMIEISQAAFDLIEDHDDRVVYFIYEGE
jgi:hypothetical protein